MDILFENPDFIAVNKRLFIPVQASPAGGDSLESRLAAFLARRVQGEGEGESLGDDASPFVGLLHRIDQPVTGAVLFAKNPRSLARGSALFRNGGIRRIYWAVCIAPPAVPQGRLEHHLSFHPRKNKARAYSRPGKGSRRAILDYRLLGRSERYFFLEIRLVTGRPHQIRAQLAAAGCPIRGDLKYGAPRSNPGGGIHLHARELVFKDRETEQNIQILAPTPQETLWSLFPGDSLSGDRPDSGRAVR